MGAAFSRRRDNLLRSNVAVYVLENTAGPALLPLRLVGALVVSAALTIRAARLYLRCAPTALQSLRHLSSAALSMDWRNAVCKRLGWAVGQRPSPIGPTNMPMTQQSARCIAPGALELSPKAQQAWAATAMCGPLLGQHPRKAQRVPSADGLNSFVHLQVSTEHCCIPLANLLKITMQP